MHTLVFSNASCVKLKERKLAVLPTLHTVVGCQGYSLDCIKPSLASDYSRGDVALTVFHSKRQSKLLPTIY